MDADLRYARVIRMVAETPWAIQPETLAVIVDVLRFRAGGDRLTREEIQARLPAETKARGVGMSVVGGEILAADGKPAGRKGAVAVIPIHGVIAARASSFEDTSSSGAGLDRFTERLRSALSDPAVGSIVLDIDSPGGSVYGVAEAAAEVLSAREQKKIVAVANHLAASAAYWIGASASEFVVAPSGVVGSIGVFSAHQDLSARMELLGVKTTLISAGKYKTEGNPFAALSDEARGAMQATVDSYYGMFVDGVAKGRGVKAKDVRSGFGEGRVVTADQAVKEGMADKVATLEATIDRMLGRKPGAGPMKAEEAPAPVARDAVAPSLALRRRRLALFAN
ncbi:MAG: hypothetical protein RJA55_602 [Acidobacteriota bacterium]|jgi:signal peptide peptidase SppA